MSDSQGEQARLEGLLEEKNLAYDPASLSGAFGVPGGEDGTRAGSFALRGAHTQEEMRERQEQEQQELTDVLACLLTQVDVLRKKQLKAKDRLAEVNVCLDDCEPLHLLPLFLEKRDEEKEEEEEKALDLSNERPAYLLMGPTDFGISTGTIGAAQEVSSRAVKRRRLNPPMELQHNWNALTRMMGMNGAVVDRLAMSGYAGEVASKVDRIAE